MLLFFSEWLSIAYRYQESMGTSEMDYWTA